MILKPEKGGKIQEREEIQGTVEGKEVTAETMTEEAKDILGKILDQYHLKRGARKSEGLNPEKEEDLERGETQEIVENIGETVLMKEEDQGLEIEEGPQRKEEEKDNCHSSLVKSLKAR